MPSKSPAQAKLMRAVAHGWKPDRMKGPSRKVAKEFVAADKKVKGMQYGGILRALKKAKAEREGKLPDAPREPRGKIPRIIQQALREQQSQATAAETAAYTGDPATGPLWNEYLVNLQAEGDPELIGPRTAGAQMGDPTQYAISTKPVASRGEPTPAMSQERRGALLAAGYTPGTGRYSGYMMPPAELLGGAAPVEGVPPRTTQPIPGEGGLIDETPPAKAVTPASLRAEIPERLRGMIAGAGRTPPALLQYLQQLRGPAPEPVEMQRGGAMDFMFRGRVPQQLQQGAGQGQPPGGGGPVDRGAAGKFLTEGRVPGGGVPLRGVGRPPGMGRPGAGGGRPDPAQMRQYMEKKRAQAAGRGQPPGPGAGGVATPGGGGGAGAYQRFLQQQQPTAPGAGGGSSLGEMQRRGMPPGGGQPGGFSQAAVMPGRQFMPGGGGAGMPGGGNRIGMGDQQGALARAMQVQTGRPPISRRQPFPGRGGPGGGFGRSRGRRRGRMRR